MIIVLHIVNVPALEVASHRYRDGEGLIVNSSAASTFSALRPMCRTLADLHTVVWAQTHLVGKGEGRRLVKYWVVRWSSAAAELCSW